MTKRRYTERVEKGVGYLDIQYDAWWTNVDVAKLSMYSPIVHVLAQVRHELYYETPEFCMRSRLWNEERGFELNGAGSDWVELNMTWALRINELRFERSTDARK